MGVKGKLNASKTHPPIDSPSLTAPKKPVKKERFTPINPETINLGRTFTIMALVTLLLAAGAVWAGPGINIDLMTSLAGGRDVAEGHLGQPDNWSFITGGRVWLDQNWGSGLIFYLCQRALGYNGLLWLKALLIGLCALFALLAARRRKVVWPVALLSTALIMITTRNYLYLRPNIMTLIFAPLVLWLLYCSWERPARIWLAAGLMILWANLHGGFIFGLGVMALWSACLLTAAVTVHGMKGFKRYWQLIAATVIAVLLAGVANPFGMANLTHPFLILEEKYWRNVAEWQPLFGTNFNFANTWEFLLITGAIFILSLRTLMIIWKNKPAQNKTPHHQESVAQLEEAQAPKAGVIVFELILSAVLVFMAFESRRFIPLALVMTIPVLAKQIEWLAIRRWSIAALAGQPGSLPGRYRPHKTVVILALPVLLSTFGQINRVLHYYHPQNPLSTSEPFFDKMNLAYHFFPDSLARFINDNQIAGNVFSNWEWEGYLRWRCPQLKLFAGSRAQQVYRVSEYQKYNEILTSQSPAEELKRLRIQIAACSYAGVFTNFINRLVASEKWAVIFNDNYNCLLVDLAWTPGRILAERVLKGQLVFPDRALGLLSQASVILSPGMDEEPSKAIALLEQAVKLRPMSKGYQALANFILTESNQTRKVAAFLEKEAKRLEKMDPNTPDGLEILMSRYWISMILNQYYTGAKKAEEAQYAQEDLQTVRQEITATHEQWDYQRN
ncbi:MAG: hypothetical protein K6U80_12290 [Firmicutes bacterium]|nr:hypothetical protein [Bacillota bacterium]